jgi:hypothetical protein
MSTLSPVRFARLGRGFRRLCRPGASDLADAKNRSARNNDHSEQCRDSNGVADDDTFAKDHNDGAIALNLKLYPLSRGVVVKQPDPGEIHAQAPRCAENQRAWRSHGAGIAGNREAARQGIGRNRPDLAGFSWTAWPGSLGCISAVFPSKVNGALVRSVPNDH